MKPSHQSMSATPHLHHGGLIQGKIERKKKKKKEVYNCGSDLEDEVGRESLKWRGDETMKRERGRYLFSRE